jgi:uncharacterized protein (TIGR00251 family)
MTTSTSRRSTSAVADALLRVRVTPKSSRDEVVGWFGDELSVRVTAPPDKGKANAAACRVVAKLVGVPKSSVCVARGHASRHKTLTVAGRTDSEVAAVLPPR